jgi:hypothetical protein
MHHGYYQVIIMTAKQICNRLEWLKHLVFLFHGHIPWKVRLISAEITKENAYFYIYVDGEFTEQDEEDLREGFYHLDPGSWGEEEFKYIRIDRPYVIDYQGDCVFAWSDNLLPNTPILKEHSICLAVDKHTLPQWNKTILRQFHSKDLKGSCELVQFDRAIGFYKNPTTNQDVITSRAIIYYGESDTHIIPAVPDFSWFEKLQQQAKKEKIEISLRDHIVREVERALLGRIGPNLLSANIHWERIGKPYFLRFYVTPAITLQEREMLELAWCEMRAGLPDSIDFQIQFITQEHSYWVPSLGESVYSKLESIPENFEEEQKIDIAKIYQR